MDNLAPGCSDKDIERYFGSAYSDWLDERSDELLEDFLEAVSASGGWAKAFISLPPVKSWNPEQVATWENFCREAYNDEHNG